MFLRATKAEPENPMPHYYLGYFYKDKGKKKEALRHFQAYLEILGDKDSDFRQEVEDEIYFLKH